MNRLYSVLIVIILSTCSTQKSPLQPVKSNAFEIYMLVDSISIAQALDLGIDNIEIGYNPLLSAGDIDYYDFTNHAIHLKENVKFDFKNESLETARLFRGKAFVVCANDEPIYIGGFYSIEMSYLPPCPIINVGISSMVTNGEHVVSIRLNDWTDGPDERGDVRIKNALLEAGLLRLNN